MIPLGKKVFQGCFLVGGGPGAEIGKKSDFDPKCAKKKTIELFDADLN
jgi:hypothetical protein